MSRAHKHEHELSDRYEQQVPRRNAKREYCVLEVTAVPSVEQELQHAAHAQENEHGPELSSPASALGQTFLQTGIGPMHLRARSGKVEGEAGWIHHGGLIGP